MYVYDLSTGEESTHAHWFQWCIAGQRLLVGSRVMRVVSNGNVGANMMCGVRMPP